MKLVKSRLEHLDKIEKMRIEALRFYKEYGLNWDERYPNKETFKKDIEKEELYELIDKDEILGVVVLNSDEDINYKKGKWVNSEKGLVVHRLMIDPKNSGRGLGKTLMSLIEEEGRNRKLLSIKLDTNTENIRAQRLYESMGFERRGIINLNGKDGEFYIYEKIL